MSVTTREGEQALDQLEPIRPPRGREVLAKVGIPVLGVAAGLLGLLVLLPPELRDNALTFLGIYLIPGGIDAAPALGVSLLGLDPLWVVGLTVYFDLWLTLFWVWNLDHLVRFDVVRGRVEKSRERAHQLWDRFPWLRVATAPGLALFITIPIPTTGSFSGIAIGKLIDLPDPAIYLASVAGTFVRIVTLAYGTEGVLWFF